VGLFGGRDKTIKKLDEELTGARIMTGELADMLPEANFQTALQRTPPSIAQRVRAAKEAGFGQEARDLLQKELGQPRQSARAEALRQKILEAALAEL
jgi:hypothetical protein